MMQLAITGATSGIGAEKAKALAPKCSRVFLLVRNEEKAKELVHSIDPSGSKDKFTIIYCDLADLKSVAAAAKTLNEATDTLDLLINNAGGIFPEKTLTEDGHELTFSANHLGHFLLTQLLMPLLINGAGGRVISVSSEAHKGASVDRKDLELIRNFSSFKAYANAKLYNILFTKSLAEKYADKKLEAYALHPGVVNTGFGNQSKGIFKILLSLFKPLMISPAKGAETGIFLATTAKVPGKNGDYFKKSKVASVSSSARSKKLRDQLWEYSMVQIKDFV
ncbi:SDR family NAD(P)-dependent oxidoreductase [Cyclobacterium jeungdonense]|uniref:SDR family NAD(P)-dependent oxidoreductase n=1 Tax=Cyclobacterium jeungdonense TaxID=708087 RepID=A0ABT8C7I5_9BACT|nr:SDR family NAD(P)-dependent oxidoreductase [Cyclobacterium jeungdonense]MDN3688475.1 SDR family NAD(P)-dependent oxidoreductase [Cyclobacterium jeungdonense]